MKKVLCIALCLMFIMSNITTAFALENDYENNWAKNEIEYMKNRGIISGYPDGSFKPSNNMSKAEFYKVINKIMGFTNESEINFSDVVPENWYYDEVAKGVAANYIIPAVSLDAGKNINRGEVARIIGIVFSIAGDKQEANFTDNDTIPEELKATIGGLKKNGFINGYPDGSFRVDAEITRAEVVKMLHNIAGEIVNEEGIVSKNADKNLVVNTADVTLKDMEVGGNLYLAEGIGEGDVFLDNVKVKNIAIVNGGGENSIDIRNSQLKSLLLDKKQNLLNIILSNTKIDNVTNTNQIKLQLTQGSTIKNLELKDKAELVLEKNSLVENLKITGGDISINAQGSINYIESVVKFKVNGVEANANTKYKIVDGKLMPLNTTVSSSSGTGGYIPQPIEYTVTFKLEGGNIGGKTDDKIEKVIDKSTVKEPSAPIRDGYSFVGWFEDGHEEKFNFSTLITKSLTIKAKWELKTVELDKRALVEAIAAAQTKNEDDYTLESWARFEQALQVAMYISNNANSTQAEVDTALENLRAAMGGLDEKEEPETPEYTVTLNLNGGNIDGNTDNIVKVVTEGAIMAKPTTNPVKDGFDFKGWFKDLKDETPFDFSTPITANLSLIAKWEETKPVEPAEIENIKPNSNITLWAGNTLTVSFNAPAGGTAYFRINVAEDIPMRNIDGISVNNDSYKKIMVEVSPEYYEAIWTIPNGIIGTFKIEVNFEKVADKIRLRDTANGILTIVKAPDKTALAVAIESAEEKIEDSYTPETWQVFAQALREAIAINNNIEATQEEVNIALNNLITAMNNLVEKTVVDKSALISAIATAQTKNENDYTPESWTNFAQALQAAITVNNNIEATQSEVNTALDNLTTAMSNLVEKTVVDKSALIAAIALAGEKLEDKYTPETWQVFALALQAAITVNNNAQATQEEVNTALNNLTTAMNALVEKPVGPAPTIIAKYQPTFMNNFSFIYVGVGNLQNAAKFSVVYYIFGTDGLPKLTETKIFNINEKTGMIFYNPSQFEAITVKVYNQNQDLLHTFEGVIPVLYEEPAPVVDKTALIEAIAAAQTKIEDDYTPESWIVFEQALQEAIAVNNNANATQVQVNVALAGLNTAMSGLEEKEEPTPVVDKTALAAAIVLAQTKNENDYTPESWTIFAQALQTAVAVSNNANATQNEVNTATTNLNNAMNGLVLKPSNPATISAKYYTTFISNMVNVSVVVENLDGKAKFDIIFNRSDNADGTPNVDISEKANMNERSKAIWYNPTSKYKTITIRIYDINNNVIHTFENVTPVKGN